MGVMSKGERRSTFREWGQYQKEKGEPLLENGGNVKRRKEKHF
jgi:hypothetical protein